MRWLTYYILAYVALGLQIGLAHHIAFGAAKPNLVLLAVVFIAVNAPRDAALLGCFGLGVVQDLTSAGPLGLYAFSYGLVALFIVGLQDAIYRGHPLAQLALALIGMLITAAVLLAHGWTRGPRESILAIFYSALYTALLAPIVLGILHRFRRAFAFQSSGRRRGGGGSGRY